MYEGKGIDRNEFNACFANTEGRVEYELGAKPALGSDSDTFDKSDCSGFSRWMLSRTLEGFTDEFPDGSSNQHAWCSDNLAAALYYDALQDRTNAIFIAFMDQNPATEQVTRHVWFVQNGATIECCGGKGVYSSQKFAEYYSNRVSGCYHIPSYLE
jgi:hypothetical protein